MTTTKAVLLNFDPPFNVNPPDGYLLAYQASSGFFIPVNVPLGINRKLSQIITAITNPPPAGYVVQAADDFLCFDTSVGQVDGYLPSVPVPGKGYTFADVTGHASVNSVVVVGNGFLISGNPTFTLSTNFQTVTVVFNGVGWSIV